MGFGFAWLGAYLIKQAIKSDTSVTEIRRADEQEWPNSRVDQSDKGESP
jgi:hypothetical protein